MSLTDFGGIAGRNIQKRGIDIDNIGNTVGGVQGGRFIKDYFTDDPITTTRLGAGAATGAEGDLNLVHSGGYIYTYIPHGTQTILGPVRVDSPVEGLNITQDLTNNDGVEYLFAGGSNVKATRGAVFTTGTDAFYGKLKLRITDVSGTDQCAFGFRKVQAIQTAYTSYTELASLDVVSGTIKIRTDLAGAGHVVTSTTQSWADAATHTLEVYVSQAGVVTYQIDGAPPTVTAAFTFTSGSVVQPWFWFLNDTDVAETTCLMDLEVGLQTAR